MTVVKTSARKRALPRIDARERGIPPVAMRPDIACRPADNPLFYSEPGVDPRKAIALCRRCPRQLECLLWALKTNQQYGVWGGMTPNGRTRLRRALKATPRTAS